MILGTYSSDRLSFTLQDGTVYKFDNEDKAHLLTGSCEIYNNGVFTETVYILKGKRICNINDEKALISNNDEIQEMFKLLGL